MGKPNWFIDIIRILFCFLDNVVYWLVDIIYQLLIMISETGVFSPSTISEFAGRIYALLGIFMLFKVSFSLITYILNPDNIADKNKGLGKLLTNFFVVLIGIVAVPYVFQAAYSLQSVVLEENVIGNLIMGNLSADGEGTSEQEAEDYVKKGGDMMAFTTLSAFIKLNDNVVGPSCASHPIEKSNGDFVLSSDCTSNQNAVTALNISFSGSLNNESFNTIGDALRVMHKNKSTKMLTQIDLINLKATDSSGVEAYLFDYSILVSTVAGGFLAWILLMFCIDIALRSVKLGFLQLIAPIPIISYVDPKGQSMFQKWLKECGKTYADLFIRLIAIYFSIYIISEIDLIGGYYNVTTGQVVETNSFTTLLVKILIIFGALMFAKQLPQLLESLLGFKFGGGFTLNPMNKLQQVPLVGAATTNLLGRTAGAIEAARHDQTGNRWRSAASGWFAAGNALHGKVPMMGAKPGASTVRSIHTGREAGFEAATGNKMRAHSRINDLFREDGKNRIDDLKNKYRAPLQQELNDIGLQKQEVANSYNRLNEQFQRASTESERTAIRAKMQQAQERYRALASREAKVSGDIATINDQIKDLERAYDIDKSPVKKINEVKGRVDTTTGRVKDGAYGDRLEPIDYSVPESNQKSSTNEGNQKPSIKVKVTKKTGGSSSGPASSSGTSRVTVKKKNQ